LPPNRNHIDHVESAGLQGSLEIETAGGRTGSASTRITETDGRDTLPVGDLSGHDWSRKPQYFGKVYPAKSIEKPFHALPQVVKVDGSRKNDEIGGVYSPDYRGKLILNDAALLGQTDAPSVLIALSAPFQIVLGKE
jgi:hypothetical protein